MRYAQLKISFALPLMAIALLLAACGEPADKKIGEEEKTKPKEPKASTLVQVGNEHFSIPSPMQTSYLIKNSGANFDKALLNDPRNAPSYSTKFYRALNLGIFGADLGYVTLYDEHNKAIQYMNSCKRIGDELGVSGAFSPEMLKRFEANMGNQDSLLMLVSDAYSDSDKFLKNNDRSDVGCLVLAGGWIESLHFASKVADMHSNPAVVQRIGEQKITLENLIKLLEKNANDEEYLELIDHLTELFELFDDVTVTYKYAKPTIDKEKKLAVINSTSEVSITEEQLTAIYEKIESIREQIVS